MEQCTFKYLGILGVVHSQVFDILCIGGLDVPHKWNLVPPRICEIVDGSRRTQYAGFQRIIEVDLASINEHEDFLRAFLQADAKSLSYKGQSIVSEEVQVVFEETEFETEWFGGFKKNKQFKFDLLESVVRTVWTEPNNPVENMIQYTAKKILITGTQESPELFETNVGKILYEYGMTSFPNISLLSYIVSVNVIPYQNCQINQVGNITQNGNNIRFYLAIDNRGNPADADNFYGDIEISLRTIV